MIIYIHGFGGSGEGTKAQLFRNHFKSIEQPFIAPSLSYVPTLAVTTLQELIESYDDVQIIGSSLGGFYAMYLAQQYGLKAVLINPSIYPYNTLKRALGDTPSYYDESYFEWKETHLAMLAEYKTEIINQQNIMLLAQEDDEIVDYREAVKLLHHAYIVVEKGGNHSFEGIDRYFEKITDFFQLKRNQG